MAFSLFRFVPNPLPVCNRPRHRILMYQIRRILFGLGIFWLLPLTQGERVCGDEPRAFLRQHCVKCHGPDQQEGDLRLDTLGAPDSDSAETWSLVADLIESGDMPPKDERRPAVAEIKPVLSWIGAELSRVGQPLPAIRRLNRLEYENTVHDLLGIDSPLAPLLPEDGQVQGFDNVASGLGISSILLERYLEAADVAFEQTIRRIEPLSPETRRATLMESKENIGSVKAKKGGVIESHGAFVDFTPGWPPARVDEAHPIESGVYRCRVAVFPHDPGEHRTLSVGIFTGPLFGPGKRNFNGVFDVTGTPEDPRIIEFTTRLGEGHAFAHPAVDFSRACDVAGQARSTTGSRHRLGGNPWPARSGFPLKITDPVIRRLRDAFDGGRPADLDATSTRGEITVRRVE